MEVACREEEEETLMKHHHQRVGMHPQSEKDRDNMDDHMVNVILQVNEPKKQKILTIKTNHFQSKLHSNIHVI